MRNLINELNKAYNYPPDYIAASLLGAASIAVGNNHVLKVKDAWEERCVFFIVLVGSPGSNKSHPLTFAMQPLSNATNLFYNEYNDQLKEYKSSRDDKETPNEIPYPKRLYVINATIEKYIEIHSQNPNGIGIYSDEFASLLNTLAKYNKGNGSDISTLLSIWSGKELMYDRKSSSESILLPKPYTPIIGTTQPRIIQELINKENRDNGFMDRVLLAYPDNIYAQPIDFKEYSTSAENLWEEIISTIISERDHHITYMLSKEAQQVFSGYSKTLADSINSTSNDYYKALLAKMDIYCLRFALLMEVLNNAIEANHKGYCAIKEEAEVQKESLETAVAICNYFLRTGLKFREGISIISPFESLPEKQQHLYNQLEKTFPSKDAMDKGIALGLSTATINRLLGKDNLFKRKERGIYQKVNKIY